MANTKSAGKRSRQTAKRTLRNRSVRTGLRRMNKARTASSGTGDANANAEKNYISALDKAAKRGIIHRNAANRRKARLNKARKAASAPAPAAS